MGTEAVFTISSISEDGVHNKIKMILSEVYMDRMIYIYLFHDTYIGLAQTHWETLTVLYICSTLDHIDTMLFFSLYTYTEYKQFSLY